MFIKEGNVIENLYKNELSGWNAWEIIWLFLACGIIAILSIYWQGSVMGILSATTGVACVVCTGKGKLRAYIFGTINVVLYAIIAYNEKFYGEVMLNALYYLPMEFYGFYVWSKNMDSKTHEVKKREMNVRGKLLLLLSVVAGTVGYGYFPQKLGGSLPYIDALSTVVSVVAMIILVKMFAEQWILWIVVDVVTVIMWAIAFMQGSESIATLLMWIVYLGNAVIMYIKWKKEAKVNAL